MTWQNETVSDEEEKFWMPLINERLVEKNPNCSDKDRVRLEKWKIKKGKERVKVLDKILKIDRAEESKHLKEFGFSIQHACHYIGTLSLEDGNGFATILGVI